MLKHKVTVRCSSQRRSTLSVICRRRGSHFTQHFKVAYSGRAAWLTDGLIKLFLISLKSSPADSYYHNELSRFCFKSSPPLQQLFERSHHRRMEMEGTSCCWKVSDSSTYPWARNTSCMSSGAFSHILLLLETHLVPSSDQWICFSTL